MRDHLWLCCPQPDLAESRSLVGLISLLPFPALPAALPGCPSRPTSRGCGAPWATCTWTTGAPLPNCRTPETLFARPSCPRMRGRAGARQQLCTVGCPTLTATRPAEDCLVLDGTDPCNAYYPPFHPLLQPPPHPPGTMRRRGCARVSATRGARGRWQGAPCAKSRLAAAAAVCRMLLCWVPQLCSRSAAGGVGHWVPQVRPEVTDRQPVTRQEPALPAS